MSKGCSNVLNVPNLLNLQLGECHFFTLNSVCGIFDEIALNQRLIFVLESFAGDYSILDFYWVGHFVLIMTWDRWLSTVI